MRKHTKKMTSAPKPFVVALILAAPVELLNLAFAIVHFKGIATDALWVDRLMYEFGLFLSFPVYLSMHWHLLPDRYFGAGVFIGELFLTVLSGYSISALLIAGGIYGVLRICRVFRDSRS